MSNDVIIGRVGGVVILYEPDQRIISNIVSYVDCLHTLIIVDNSSQENATIEDYFSNKKNVSYIFNNGNLGIGAALNKGGELALENGCSWLLTMDQDSYFDAIQIRNYVEWIHTKSPETLAIAGISFDGARGEQASGEIEVCPVRKVITSGSMVNLKSWQALKRFDENLFIDEVDHEYCYRAIVKGYQVCKLQNVSMHHQIGRSVIAGYFGVFAKKPRMIHSPLRIYYMVRNYLYTRKKYIKDLPEEFEVRDSELMTILKNNLFFSGKFFATLGMAVGGYLDYRKGVFGKYT